MLNEAEGNRALPKAPSVLFVWEHCRNPFPLPPDSGVLRVLPLFGCSSAPSELNDFTAELFPAPYTGLVLHS